MDGSEPACPTAAVGRSSGEAAVETKKAAQLTDPEQRRHIKEYPFRHSGVVSAASFCHYVRKYGELTKWSQYGRYGDRLLMVLPAPGGFRRRPLACSKAGYDLFNDATRKSAWFRSPFYRAGKANTLSSERV